MLDIVASYQYMQFQGDLMNQTEGNSKKLVLSMLLAPLVQIRVA